MPVKQMDVIYFLYEAGLDRQETLRRYGDSQGNKEKIQKLFDRIKKIQEDVSHLPAVIEVRYYHMPTEEEIQIEERDGIVPFPKPNLALNGVDSLEKLEAFVGKIEGLVESAQKEQPQRALICFTPKIEDIRLNKQGEGEEQTEQRPSAVLIEFFDRNEQDFDKLASKSIVSSVKQDLIRDYTVFLENRGFDRSDISEQFVTEIPETVLSAAVEASKVSYESAKGYKDQILEAQKRLSSLRSQAGGMTNERFQAIEKELRFIESCARDAEKCVKRADAMLKIASAFKDPKQNPGDRRFNNIAYFAKEANQASKQVTETVKQILPGRFAKGVAKAAYYLGSGLALLGIGIVGAVAAPFLAAQRTYSELGGGLGAGVTAVAAFLVTAGALALFSYVTFGIYTPAIGAWVARKYLNDGHDAYAHLPDKANPFIKFSDIFKKIDNFCNKNVRERVIKALARKEKLSVKGEKESSQELSSANASATKDKVPDEGQKLGATLAAVAQQSEAQQSSSLSAAATKHLTQTGKELASEASKQASAILLPKILGTAQPSSSSSSNPESHSPASSSTTVPLLRAVTVANKDSISTDRGIPFAEFEKFRNSIERNVLFQDVLKKCHVLHTDGRLSLSGVAESVCSVAKEWVKTQKAQQAQQGQQTQDKSAIGFKVSGNNLDKVKELFQKAEGAELSITTVTIGRDTYTADAFREKFIPKKEQASLEPSTPLPVQPVKPV